MKSSPRVIRELKSKEETGILGKTLSEDQIGNLQGKIKGALKILNEKKIVVSQKRMRADLSKPHPTEEMLHSAPDFITLLREFGGDREVLRYRREITGYY